MTNKILPVSKPTVGAEIDIAIAGLHSRLAALELNAVTEEKKVATWIKANIAHVPTYAALGYAFFKHLL
jgi:hypothetical protein